MCAVAEGIEAMGRGGSGVLAGHGDVSKEASPGADGAEVSVDGAQEVTTRRASHRT